MFDTLMVCYLKVDKRSSNKLYRFLSTQQLKKRIFSFSFLFSIIFADLLSYRSFFRAICQLNLCLSLLYYNKPFCTLSWIFAILSEFPDMSHYFMKFEDIEMNFLSFHVENFLELFNCLTFCDWCFLRQWCQCWFSIEFLLLWQYDLFLTFWMFYWFLQIVSNRSHWFSDIRISPLYQWFFISITFFGSANGCNSMRRKCKEI